MKLDNMFGPREGKMKGFGMQVGHAEAVGQLPIWTAVGFLRPSPQLASQPSLRLGCRGAHLLCLASLNSLHTLYLSFICVFYSVQMLEDLRCFNPRSSVEHMLRQRQTLVLGCEASGASRHCESTFATARALF